MTTCKGTTLLGEPCKNPTFGKSEFCYAHDKTKRKNKKKPSKHAIARMVKDAQAFTLRMAGASFQQIADQVGYADPSGAYRAFQRALKLVIIETPDEMRHTELSRLDQVHIEIFRQASGGQLGAVDRMLKIQDRRSKLMGLDAAERVEHSGIGGGPIEVKEVIIRGPKNDE